MADNKKGNSIVHIHYYQPKPKVKTPREKALSFIHTNSQGIKGVLTLILATLILIALYRFSVGKNIPLFGDLLNMLSTMPKLDIPMLSSVAVISAETLGIFSFLLPVLEIIMTILDMLVFLINGATNILLFGFHFVKWIFILP